MRETPPSPLKGVKVFETGEIGLYLWVGAGAD
jgi:hypothetical protein